MGAMPTAIEAFRDWLTIPADDQTCLRAMLAPYEGVAENFVTAMQQRMVLVRAVCDSQVPYIDNLLALFSGAVERKLEAAQGRKGDYLTLQSHRNFPEPTGRGHLTLQPASVAISRTISFYDAGLKTTHELTISINRASGDAGIDTRSYSDENRFVVPTGERCVTPIEAPAQLQAALERWFKSVAGYYAPVAPDLIRQPR